MEEVEDVQEYRVKHPILHGESGETFGEKSVKKLYPRGSRISLSHAQAWEARHALKDPPSAPPEKTSVAAVEDDEDDEDETSMAVAHDWDPSAEIEVEDDDKDMIEAAKESQRRGANHPETSIIMPWKAAAGTVDKARAARQRVVPVEVPEPKSRSKAKAKATK